MYVYNYITNEWLQSFQLLDYLYFRVVTFLHSCIRSLHYTVTILDGYISWIVAQFKFSLSVTR